MPAPPVLLVPVLPAEGWTSIDLYRGDLERGFAEAGLPAPGIVLPNEDPAAPWWRRQADLYWSLPRALRAARARHGGTALVHVLDHSYAHLCRAAPRAVVTCHDLAPLRVRELAPHREAIFRWRIAGLRRAAAVVCVSQNTARDVAELARVEECRILVNPLGVDPAFAPGPPGCRRPGFTILHVGSLLRRKNLPVLLRALARLRQTVPDAVLVRIGARLGGTSDGALVARLGLEGAVIELGTTAHATLVAAYRAADAFVLPSLYEGFGRPVLEAQACGTPTLLADGSSLREVGGAGALYFPPEDDAALAALLARLATEPALRARLAAAGIANARRFTWRGHVERLAEVYGAVAAGDL